MGGYGSGRTKRHELTNECISIDTMALKKHLHKPGKVGGSFTVSGLSERHFKDGKANLCCIVECYTTPQQSHGARYPVYGQVSLHYAVQSDTQPENHAIDIPLVTTTCNYGGQRWWMIAPC